MASGTALDRFTEKQILNMNAPYTTKGKEINFSVTNTEATVTLENTTSMLKIYSPIPLWLSFTATGTGSGGSQRLYVSANEWNDISQGNFVDAFYIVNYTAGQTGVVHVKYRD